MQSDSFTLFCLISPLYFLHLVSAQLTGSITSPGNPFIVTVNITNPTTSTISILKWNNIFDNETQLPVSFEVKDGSGDDIQIGSTYAMRSGMTNSDLYVLEPQQTFTKILDLRGFLQSLPSGPSGLHPKVIQISLPPIFQGIAHEGAYSVPPEAAADGSGQRLILGDFSAAGLEEITLEATPLRLAFQFPIFQQVFDDIGPADGTWLATTQCTGSNATGDSDALVEAGIYAHSIQLAASNANSILYRSYFPDGSQETVKAIAGAIANSTRRGGPHVDLYCADMLRLCGPNSNILGYTFTPSWIGSDYIVLCPSALSLGKAPAPCSTPAGTQVRASTSQVLLHLMLTMNNVVGKVISNSVYGPIACRKLLQASKARGRAIDPLKNVDSFVQLAVAQWRYGLGGAPYTGAACLPSNGNSAQNDKRAERSESLEQPIQAMSSDTAFSRRQANVGDFHDGVIKRAEQCKGDQQTLVQYAAENARAMARAARDSTDDELWKQTFNGNIAVKLHVRKIFDIISKWNTTSNPSGVHFLCDPRRRSGTCSYGSTAAAISIPSRKQAYLIFCPQFFYNPAALPCSTPSTRTPYIADQAGSILHELLHVSWLVNWRIRDGFSPTSGEGACYGWNCVTTYARERALPGYDDPRNFPENVATSYEYFAYAARAAEANCTGVGASEGWMEWAGSLFGLRH